ncbi:MULTISPECIES: lasso peptide biosynthesis PqqD family chaperone [Actinosynnema]|uniref:lasso peptide biosynthesis PqqD family chaperone n=1 Tax=Actinosynnema TaxID=40566 RepID=UPI0020A59BB9|nr:lasso peptide biosynthesis PqqD family chaperone [Actinosynnema pretiosum]MCP2094440.1 Coenzyme PQQ synthesis protein D (PqqD) [Actinosynnema pretiosum]
MRLVDGVSVADTEYGAVLLDGSSGDYWQLNPTGVLVLRGIADGLALDAVVEQVTTEFEVDREVAERDVSELVAELRGQRLLRD